LRTSKTGRSSTPSPETYVPFPLPARQTTDEGIQECMIGLTFSSESEAAELFKKVSLRHKYAKKAGTSSTPKKASSSSSGTVKKKKGGGVDKSMIGAPSGFSHVAHMGFDTEKGFSSTNVDPSWERLLGQLESQGISRVRLDHWWVEM
jgi:hypothetical protein